MLYLQSLAGIAQLVERNLAKVEVASSNLVSRSTSTKTLIFLMVRIPSLILLLISFDPCQSDIAQTKQEYGQLLILVAMAFQQSHEKYPEDEP